MRAIEEKLRELGNICRERGWNLASVNWHDQDDFTIIIENPENSGLVKLRVQGADFYTDLTSLQGHLTSFRSPSYFNTRKVIEEKLNILLKVFKKKWQVGDWKAILSVLEKIILRDKISIYTSWAYYVTCARIALEIGMKVNLQGSFAFSKPVGEKNVEHFTNLYGDVMKSIPEQKLLEILLRNPLIDDFVYYDAIAENLPKLPSIVYRVKAKERLTEDDFQMIRKAFFEENMSRRLILAEALIHRLMNNIKDVKLKKTIIEYLDKRATRREALKLWWIFLRIKGHMFVKGGGGEVLKKMIEKALNLKNLKTCGDREFLKLPEKVLLDVSLGRLSIRPVEQMFDYTFGIDIIFEKPPWKLKAGGLRNLTTILSRSIAHVSEMRNYVMSIVGKMTDIFKMIYLSHGDIEFALRSPPKVMVGDFMEDLMKNFENDLKKTFQRIYLKVGDEELPLKDLKRIIAEKSRVRPSVELK